MAPAQIVESWPWNSNIWRWNRADEIIDVQTPATNAMARRSEEKKKNAAEWRSHKNVSALSASMDDGIVPDNRLEFKSLQGRTFV
jgi:hypothetical protein